MIAAVYKSYKKKDCYLFVEKRDYFDKVPETLLDMFGKPDLVTLVNLANRPSLAMADIEKVKKALSEEGYYLQVPPPEENLLKEHLAQLKDRGLLKE